MFLDYAVGSLLAVYVIATVVVSREISVAGRN